jgi:hypothetical protein
MAMPRQDPAKLAAALRENLRKRKAQSRTETPDAPEPGLGPDEEGDGFPDLRPDAG